MLYDYSIMLADKVMNYFSAVTLHFIACFLLQGSGSEFIPVFLDLMPVILFALGMRNIIHA